MRWLGQIQMPAVDSGSKYQGLPGKRVTQACGKVTRISVISRTRVVRREKKESKKLAVLYKTCKTAKIAGCFFRLDMWQRLCRSPEQFSIWLRQIENCWP